MNSHLGGNEKAVVGGSTRKRGTCPCPSESLGLNGEVAEEGFLDLRKGGGKKGIDEGKEQTSGERMGERGAWPRSGSDEIVKDGMYQSA